MQDPEDRDSPRIKAQAHPEHMALIPARQNPVRPNQMRQNLVTLGVVLAWWVARLLSPDNCLWLLCVGCMAKLICHAEGQ